MEMPTFFVSVSRSRYERLAAVKEGARNIEHVSLTMKDVFGRGFYTKLIFNRFEKRGVK
jgi:hypothetical protein